MSVETAPTANSGLVTNEETPRAELNHGRLALVDRNTRWCCCTLTDSEDFYAVSDADLDLTNVPNDFLTKLRNGLIHHPRYIKAGLSLAIDDLPLNSPFREEVIQHESQFWTERLDADWYEAAIDTTFAVYRERAWQWYSPSLRAAPPYSARHLPWYLSEATMPEEWVWYFQRIESETHWSARLRSMLPTLPVDVLNRPME